MMSAELFAKAAVWITIMVWSAGGLFARMMDTREDVANLKVIVSHHTSERGHPVGLERMETMMIEQRALREDVAAQGKTLAAICQATGADCK
jgi:hypothetical protein